MSSKCVMLWMYVYRGLVGSEESVFSRGASEEVVLAHDVLD